MDPRTVEQAERLAGLAHPVRLHLLRLVQASPDRRACVCDLTDQVPRSQATVSHHLAVLTQAGWLQREREGRWAWYRCTDQALASLELLELLESEREGTQA